MITFKLPGKLLFSALGAALVLIAMYFHGAFPGGNGSLHPIINHDLPFAKPADSAAPLRVAIYPGGAFAAGLMANGGLVTAKDSLYEKDLKLGVEFIIVEDPDRCMKLLGEGSADIVWSSVPVYTSRYRKHCDLNPVAFMLYGFSRGEDALYGDRGFTSPHELKNATVACVQGGNPHLLLLFLLHASGIGAGELKWRFTYTDIDAMELVKKGRAQLCGISAAANIVPDSFKLVCSSAQAVKLVPGIFITREDILIRKKDQLTRFSTGWFRSASELAKNRDTAAAILGKAFGYDGSKVDLLLRSVLHAGYTDNSDFFRLGQGVKPGFDYLYDLTATLWGHGNGASRQSYDNPKNTDLLVEIGDSLKKSSGGYDAGPSDSVKTPSLATLTNEYAVEFPASDYSVDFKASMAAERFARTASLFEGSPIFLYGRAGSPEEQAYSYNWGMRFYFVGKMLEAAGISKDRISIKEIRLDPALVGRQKHIIACVIGK